MLNNVDARNIGWLLLLLLSMDRFLCGLNLPVPRTDGLNLPVPRTDEKEDPLKRDFMNDVLSQLHGIQGEVKKLAKTMENSVFNNILQHDKSDEETPGNDDDTQTELEINEAADVTRYLFSGDIRLSEDEMEQLTSNYNGRKGGPSYDAITEDLKQWPDGIIPYTFDIDFNEKGKTAVHDAMEEFSNKTCIKFKPRTNETDYVDFFHGRGCWSWAGNQGHGVQQISLQKGGCVKKGIAVHEIMHALGYEHEHMRPDRDKYIEIVWENIRPNNRIQFNVLNNNTFGGKKYDYGSIMHYSNKAFAIDNSKKTILVKEEGAVIGQRKGMSEIDAWSVNKLYCNCKIRNDDNKTSMILS